MSYKFDSLLIILNKLDRGEWVTVKRLAEELRVSERTVFRYLRTLESAGFPIWFDREKGGYTFMEGYSLKKPGLTPEESLTLGLSRMVMAGLGDEWEKNLGKIEEKLAVHRGELPQHIVLTAGPLRADTVGHLRLIHEAMVAYRRIRMTYRALHSNAKTRRKVDPYYLFFEEGFWYLRGYCHLREEVRTFALDRMSSLTLLEERFIPRGLDPEEELSGAFGTVVDGEPTEVVLRFDPELRPYLERRRWHGSQRERVLRDGRLELRFTVNGLEGIRPWILRWLPGVEVVSPKRLRTRIREDLQEALSRHP